MRVRLFALVGCAALGVVGCGGAGGGGDDTNVPPGEMCPTGESPMMAAYTLDSGRLQWVACSPDEGLFIAEAASDDTVWVLAPGGEPIALDARTGVELGRGSEAEFPNSVPDDADRLMRSSPVVDGVYVTAGQDDPLVGVDYATHTPLWENVGLLVYDDVWAIGDGAVFAMSGGRVVGYEIADGAVRWEVGALGEAIGWPWHVADGRLYLLWFNVQVLSTSDGSTIWETNYPHPASGFPRMFGVVTNDDTVFVSFTAIPSGGD